MTKYKIIKNKAELKQLVAYCNQTRYASVDFEAPLEYYKEENTPWILGVSFQPGSGWIIPLNHKDSIWKGKKWKWALRYFGKHVLENPDITKAAWNFKFELKWFMRFGIKVVGRMFDGMLAKYVFDEERPHGLKEFVSNYFPERAGYENNLNVAKGYDEPIDKLGLYCAEDCDLTLQSYIHLEHLMMTKWEGKFYILFRNLLMMCSHLLGESEYSGAKLDKPYIQDLVKIYKKKIAEAEKLLRKDKSLLKFELTRKKEITAYKIKELKLEIREIKKGESPQMGRMIAGRREKIRQLIGGNYSGKGAYEPFNFNSPKQLGQFLFSHEAGLRWPIRDKTASGEPSTAEDTLKKYQKKDRSGFIDKLLSFREVSHLDSTYVTGMLQHMDKYDRVHANFHIAGTVTGRLSCTEPNLQNIPRDTTAKDIKTMFIVPQDFVLLELDYGQAELRIVAELSGDEALIDIFRRNYNVHVATSCKMFANIKDYDKVKNILKDNTHKDWLRWEKQKKKAKSLNFSILYLQGDEATAEDLECSVPEAKQFKKEWFKQFPKVKKWIDKQIDYAHDHGYVPMLFGRHRRLHDIDSPKPYLQAESERQSVNSPIQGTSNDFALFSEVIIREKILTGEFPIDMYQTWTVHDSLGFYIRPRDLAKTVPAMIKICDNPETQKYFGFEMKHVKMKVSPEVGLHWAGLEEYDPWKHNAKFLESR